MPVTTLVSYSVDRVEVMDFEGNVDESLMPDLSDEQIMELYRTMVLTRRFDERMLKLQRAGRMGTFARVMGQEAAHIGAVYALRKGTDWWVPAFRETGGFVLWGIPMEGIISVNAGDERGGRPPDDLRLLPVSIPIATHLLHAAGIAWAMKQDGEDAVTMTSFGEGATSEGDFHEAMNFAGVFQLPMVFFCQNNQWAISVPYHKQTGSCTVAQKALGYGMPGIQLDGNDLFAAYKVVKEAVERARSGGGPTLIEAHTYRLSDHTTSDDARRYRDEDDVESWMERDPIPRLERFLDKHGLADEAEREQIREWANDEVAAAVERFESTEPAGPDQVFEHVYAEPTPALVEQRGWARRRAEEGR